MVNALEEAAAIVEAKFAEKAALQLGVEGFDPLTGAVTWKNNKLTPGASVLVGYVFGKYDEATKTFSIAVFTVDTVQYAWGSVIVATAPAQGATATPSVLSYALNLAAPTTFDVLVFIATGTLGAYAADYNKGARTIGLKLTDFQALGFVATKVFIAQITVSPYVLPVEVTGFTISKA